MATRSNLEASEMQDCLVNYGNKQRVYTDELAGNLVVSAKFPPIMFLDCGGAGRNVDLPAEADSEFLTFHIINTSDGAETITVRDDGGATIVTIAQNEGGFVACNGTVWRGYIGGIT